MAFSYEIQKVIEKAQNLRKTEDFVLLMAPAGGLEPLAYCLGEQITLCPTIPLHYIPLRFVSI